jgi:hypothetical protein
MDRIGFFYAPGEGLLPNVDRGPGVNDIAHRLAFSAVWNLDYASRARGRPEASHQPM